MTSKNPMKKMIDVRDSYDIERNEHLTDFELAGATGFPDHIIHGYAEEGLLEYKEDKDRNRLYHPDMVERLQDINDMAKRGMTISEMRREIKSIYRDMEE